MKKSKPNSPTATTLLSSRADFFKNENKTQQIDALIPQMELAYELELPVIIHCRDAANEMIAICNDLFKRDLELSSHFSASSGCKPTE